MGFELFKIMLIDDEEEVRQSIIKQMDWSHLGFEIVGDASNGEEALEMLEYLEPDLIMTDIRMPYMDGLTMINRLKESKPFIKVIIFSGFDDFEYAKQAIKLNVVEYILKPVNVEELSEILTRVRKNLSDEIEQKLNINRLRENYLKNIPIIRDQFLNDLISGKIEVAHIKNAMVNYEIPIADALYFQVIAVHYELFEENGKISPFFQNERELIPISISELIETKLTGLMNFVSIRHSGYIVLIAGFHEYARPAVVLDLMQDICRECKKILGLTITIGIGKQQDDIGGIHNSYRQAKTAANYKSFMGSGSAIYIEDMEPSKSSHTPLKFGSADENKIISAIKFGTKEQIVEAVESILSKIGNVSGPIHHYQVYLIGIVNAIVHLTQQYELSLDEIIGAQTDYFEILSAFNDTDELRQWLSDICLHINDNIYKGRKDNTVNIVSEAKKYILENYQNAELSLDTLCADLHISPSYFSTLFKKETGLSYVGYLTNTRLTQAAEYLKKTNDKTYIIASKVGYSDTNYFSYVFKKKYGVSPTKFREK